MANVYEHTLDTYDFFDTVVYCNDDTFEWEQFVKAVAGLAATEAPHSSTVFEDFIQDHGYADKIADVLYDAAKAFTNKQIIETKADFDLI